MIRIQTISRAERFEHRLYRFGDSQQLLRGPPPDLGGRYVVCLGGCATFGTFVRQPFPALLAEGLDIPVANFGVEGAGPGLFDGDQALLEVAQRARLTVIQVMGALEHSNRFYTVRPRRNRRIHAVSDMLRQIYPEVNFARFSRVPGMLNHLAGLDQRRFTMIETELRNAWVARMTALIGAVPGPVVLLWFSTRRPEDAAGLGDPDPKLVDRGMVESLARGGVRLVECVSMAGLPQDLTVRGRPVLFRPKGDPITENRVHPSPAMHRLAAEMLLPAIKRRVAAR